MFIGTIRVHISVLCTNELHTSHLYVYTSEQFLNSSVSCSFVVRFARYALHRAVYDWCLVYKHSTECVSVCLFVLFTNTDLYIYICSRMGTLRTLSVLPFSVVHRRHTHTKHIHIIRSFSLGAHQEAPHLHNV